MSPYRRAEKLVVRDESEVIRLQPLARRTLGYQRASDYSFVVDAGHLAADGSSSSSAPHRFTVKNVPQGSRVVAIEHVGCLKHKAIRHMLAELKAPADAVVVWYELPWRYARPSRHFSFFLICQAPGAFVPVPSCCMTLP
ncbi:MAG: hypothetical protein HY220_03685 [Candidatus Sungbacteria bacterium]|uniref:Uncharacterized protein n=1 Tax=Candidatus Sungiibacteriota bacterium TaxID=2750080 RepID=A0A9D6LS75_9BACT|nr:hypothetical protein [Candidatus Sungbacteria bacterium]